MNWNQGGGNMDHMEALKLLMEFKRSIDIVAQKQDELLTELNSIRTLLLTILNGGVDVGNGRTAEELCEQIQFLVDRKTIELNTGFQEAAHSAGSALSTFLAGMNSDQPYS